MKDNIRETSSVLMETDRVRWGGRGERGGSTSRQCLGHARPYGCWSSAVLVFVGPLLSRALHKSSFLIHPS